MSALLAAVAVFLGVVSVRRVAVVRGVDRYLGVGRPPDTVRRSTIPEAAPALVFGAAAGAVVLPASSLGGAVLGAGLAVAVTRARAGSSARRRASRLGQELPAVADLLALFVLSGDSVSGAMRRFVEEATGIAASEIRRILASIDTGTSFAEAARDGARSSAHRDGGRLYELLAQAHRSGSRLVDTLAMFAADRRAAIERELTIEGGKRALSGYGPILGLMVPTTLLFLMYPTLAGLDALSSTR